MGGAPRYTATTTITTTTTQENAGSGTSVTDGTKSGAIGLTCAVGNTSESIGHIDVAQRNKQWRLMQKRNATRAIEEYEEELQESYEQFFKEWELEQQNKRQHEKELWVDAERGYMNAWDEIQDDMGEGEVLEYVVFGPWSWGGSRDNIPSPEVPPSIMGRRLLPQEAEPFLKTFGFDGGYGSPECYATWVYTNKRVMWVTQYDGSTCLDHMPRHPIQGVMPYMPGG